MRFFILLFTLNVIVTAVLPRCGYGQPNLDEIISRGVEIFERDRAASVATDALFHHLKNPDEANILGWVTEPSGRDWRVTFVSRRNDDFVPVFQVWVREGRVISTRLAPPESPAVSPQLARAFLARTTALSSRPRVCSRHINPVVIPIGELKSPGAFDIYVLSATDDPDIVMAGGHSRIRVTGDGKRTLEKREFTKSCVNLQRQPGALGLYLTHITADTPEEIHVFLSLANDTPLTVITTSNRQSWLVTGRTIIPMGKLPDDTTK